MRKTSREITLEIATPEPPPYWALLERELLSAEADAIREYYDLYFDARGYQLCTPRWGGDDGPDDAAENLLNWTMLHALGAPDVVLDLYRKGWEGHLRQYTEARTVDVPLARDGMYYREFPTQFDWLHNGEACSPFVLQGLSDPDDLAFQKRTRRFAGFYMNEDPQAPNYDPERRLIRSFFNGSRGPLMRKATGLDWAGDPIEVAGRFRLRHGETSFEQMVEHFQDYNDVVGDNPMNLGTTTLAFNAYALTGEAKYRDWLLDYVGAWVERTAANGGLVPSNVGLDGTIGGTAGGRWYGGVYGWGFSVYDPPSGKLAHRPSFLERAHYGFANALLLTGERRYVDLWREMLLSVNEQKRAEGGQTLYPHMYGDQGWYEFRPEPFAHGALETYYWTLQRDVLGLLPEKPRWIAYLDGEDPDYPTAALRQDLATLRHNMEQIRKDTTTPDTRLSDETHGLNPAITETLTRLMLGGLPTGRVGGPLHARLRYFDPVARRAGLPESVGALVERMAESEVVVSLANVSPLEAREVVVQGGGYAEHQIESATVGGATVPIDHSHFTVRLAPGAVGRLTLTLRRYANQPTLAFPWQ